MDKDRIKPCGMLSSAQRHGESVMLSSTKSEEAWVEGGGGPDGKREWRDGDFSREQRERLWTRQSMYTRHRFVGSLTETDGVECRKRPRCSPRPKPGEHSTTARKPAEGPLML